MIFLPEFVSGKALEYNKKFLLEHNHITFLFYIVCVTQIEQLNRKTIDNIYKMLMYRFAIYNNADIIITETIIIFF